MKKMSKKMLAGVLALCMSVATMGCGNSLLGDTEEADSAKTQLYVYNYDGGYGSKWLQNIKQRFEEAYADYEGENGKVGVQLIIENGKTHGAEFETSISGSRHEVIFTENVQYYDFVNQELLYDLTDVLTTPLEEYGENQSIFDKFTAEQQAFYKNDEGKIYGVPYRFDIQGIVYDMDLFEEFSLYMAKGGCPSEYCEFTQKNNAEPATGSFTEYAYTDGVDEGSRSAGPDGLYGTADDGLPGTYEEFFVLCKEMTTYGVTPFIWSGQYRENYLQRNFQAMVADFEGLEDYTLKYTFDGVANHLVDSIADDGTIRYKAPTTITADNGYLMSSSAGTYYASQFMESLIKGGYYDASCFSLTVSHQDAQSDYLNSKYTANRIAFLMDGIWWENEASATFEELQIKYEGAGKMERNFGLLTMPKATMEQIGEPTTSCDFLSLLCMVNGNISDDKKELAELFVRFCFTEENNRAFNVDTGCPRSISYTLTDEDKSQLSTFGQSVYEMKKGNVVFPFANTELYRRMLAKNALGDTLKPESVSANYVWEAFKYYPEETNSVVIFRENMDNLKGNWN